MSPLPPQDINLIYQATSRSDTILNEPLLKAEILKQTLNLHGNICNFETI